MSEKRTCSIDGCEKPHEARGWCTKHYRRWRAHGDPLRALVNKSGTALERFMEHHVVHPSGCWIWSLALGRDGYGRIRDGVNVAAHRWAYEQFVGPIPDGYVIDHLCRVRHCVNPDHLAVVTPKENVLRGVNQAAIWARRSHCNAGHPFDEANTYLIPAGGRQCRKCHNAYQKQWNKRRQS